MIYQERNFRIINALGITKWGDLYYLSHFCRRSFGDDTVLLGYVNVNLGVISFRHSLPGIEKWLFSDDCILQLWIFILM